MAKYDVTKLNVGIEKCLAATTNPRHRFLLQAYHRHRFLEVAGRYEEIFAPEMMVPNPVYHFHAGGTPADLKGQENVKNLYHMWAETNQSIFFADRGRLIGEDVWEPDPDKAEIVKLDPEDVLTTAEARKLLDPLHQAASIIR